MTNSCLRLKLLLERKGYEKAVILHQMKSVVVNEIKQDRIGVI